MFKVGDKVRVKDGNFYNSCQAGAIGRVILTKKHGCEVSKCYDEEVNKEKWSGRHPDPKPGYNYVSELFFPLFFS